MTIHDILLNCGSVQSDTLIIIVNNEEAKWVGTFMNLPKDYEELKAKRQYNTVGFVIASLIALGAVAVIILRLV